MTTKLIYPKYLATDMYYIFISMATTDKSIASFYDFGSAKGWEGRLMEMIDIFHTIIQTLRMISQFAYITLVERLKGIWSALQPSYIL